MTDTNAGTPPVAGEAQQTEPQVPAAGTTPQPDEVTTLRSRNAGLDAKVTSLSQQYAAEKAAREAAEARALALAESKENGDQELRAQLGRERAALALAQREAALARIEAQYPETFAVLGETAATLSADQLAAAEARFKGVAASGDTPPPLGANPARTSSAPAKNIEDMTTAELKAHMRTFARADMLGTD